MFENIIQSQDYLLTIIYNIKPNSIFAFIISLIVILTFKRVLLSRLEIFSKKTSFDFDDFLVDILHQINWPFYLLLPTYVMLQYYTLSGVLEKWINSIFLIAVLYYSIRVIKIIIQY